MQIIFMNMLAVVWGTCVDYRTQGWMDSSTGTSVYLNGLPTSTARTYQTLPPGMTPCDLESLQQICIDRINLYRAGTLKFTNGVSDPGTRGPVAHYTANNRCANAMAMGDLQVNNGANGCVGAHTNAFACPLAPNNAGNGGQNSCCKRLGTTVAAIQSTLFTCLQAMWDEGQGLANDAPWTTANGHWQNMRSGQMTYASCSFAFASDGSVWMNQDYFWYNSTRLSACSCVNVPAGGSDGCGGICVATGGLSSPPCAAYSQTGYTMSTCTGSTPSGTTCTASCAAGYAGVVSGAPKCVSGTYSGSFSGCVLSCPASSGWPVTAAGTIVSQDCVSGVPAMGSIQRECTTSGVWGPIQSNCVGTTQPTQKPTTSLPTTSKPSLTNVPSKAPTRVPTPAPTVPTKKNGRPAFATVSSIAATHAPTSRTPTNKLTKTPTTKPSSRPTGRPTARPTFRPSFKPSSRPSFKPSSRPSFKPTIRPTTKINK